jgi:hypothetical protein
MTKQAVALIANRQILIFALACITAKLVLGLLRLFFKPWLRKILKK